MIGLRSSELLLLLLLISFLEAMFKPWPELEVLSSESFPVSTPKRGSTLEEGGLRGCFKAANSSSSQAASKARSSLHSTTKCEQTFMIVEATFENKGKH
jgi:hypothetical protein